MYIHPESLRIAADTVEALMNRAIAHARNKTCDNQLVAALVATYVDACVRTLTKEA
jgi:hypothetical protein